MKGIVWKQVISTHVIDRSTSIPSCFKTLHLPFFFPLGVGGGCCSWLALTPQLSSTVMCPCDSACLIRLL